MRCAIMIRMAKTVWWESGNWWFLHPSSDEKQEFTVKPYQQGCYVFLSEKCAHKRFPNLLDKLGDPFSMPIRLHYF